MLRSSTFLDVNFTDSSAKVYTYWGRGIKKKASFSYADAVT